jgi:hypothetical protein
MGPTLDHPKKDVRTGYIADSLLGPPPKREDIKKPDV